MFKYDKEGRRLMHIEGDELKLGSVRNRPCSVSIK